MGEDQPVRPTPEQLRLLNLLALAGGLIPAGVHQVNNPLALVKGNLDFLLRRLEDGPLAEAAQDAGVGAERLQETMKLLRSLALPRRGQRERVAVTSLLESVRPGAALALGDALEIVGPTEPDPYVHVEASQLTQALLNLLLNSWSAVSGRPRPQVILRVTEADGEVRFAVSDNGEGTGGDPERLFAPFCSEWPDGGAGLGLAVARAIAREHGGWLAAEERDDGACFVLALPVYQRQQVRGRVMLVDDDERVLDALRRLLSKRYDVSVYPSGNAAAARLAEDDDFHIIVSDLMMSDGNGRDLYTWIAASRPELLERLVFITGGAYGPDFEGFLLRVAVPVIEKPLEPDALRELVERYVSKFGD